mgnify:CR=1 FL=1
MDLASRLEALVEPALNDLGYSVVEILTIGSGRLKLDISIERLDHAPITVADCVKANREISAIMDVEDPIKAAYILEVSSPGIERPLVKKKDFKRFLGEKIKIKTHEFVEERKRFAGILQEADDEKIILALGENDITAEGSTSVEIFYDQIQRAKLNPDFKI